MYIHSRKKEIKNFNYIFSVRTFIYTYEYEHYNNNILFGWCCCINVNYFVLNQIRTRMRLNWTKKFIPFATHMHVDAERKTLKRGSPRRHVKFKSQKSCRPSGGQKLKPAQN